MVNRHFKRSVPGLGARLVELRRSSGLSQAVASVRSNLSAGVLVQAERYDLASTATLTKLAHCFSVSVDELAGRTPQRSPGRVAEVL